MFGVWHQRVADGAPVADAPGGPQHGGLARQALRGRRLWPKGAPATLRGAL